MRSKSLVKRTCVVMSIAAFLLIGPMTVYPIQAVQDPLTCINQGPFVDKVVLKVCSSFEQQVFSLLNNEIDLIGQIIDTSFLEALEDTQDVMTCSHLRNGYRYLTINCAKYPFNITSFRRALAYALDKQRISDEVWEGLAAPLDSIVPASNPFSAEGKLSVNYYESNLDEGARLLNEAGFFDIDEDGFREAPDGSELLVNVETTAYWGRPRETAIAVIDALNSLNVRAELTDYWSIWTRLNNHGDYDIAFLPEDFRDFDVRWLAYEFWSEYTNETYRNFPNFGNATFDSWREQLLHSASYEDVYEAAIEMQNILAYECPVIVCYEEFLHSAYRTDRFEGFMDDVVSGVAGRWAVYKAHLAQSSGGPYGGVLRRSVSIDAMRPNFMIPVDPSIGHRSYDYWENILLFNELWASLLIQGPDGLIYPWLAESYVVETHDDDSSVPVGYTRVVFDLLPNATWSDGNQITADDVAFTMNYYREGSDNPLGVDLSSMMAAYNRAGKVVIEFSTESYWHLLSIGFKPILPRHVFIEIGAENWSQWNPNPLEDAIVISGPFNYTDYIEGEFTELSANPLYFYKPTQEHPSTTLPSNPYSSPVVMVALGIAAISGSIVIVILGKWRRDV